MILFAMKRLKKTQIIATLFITMVSLVVITFFTINPIEDDVKIFSLIISGLTLAAFKVFFIDRFIPSLLIKYQHQSKIERPKLFIYHSKSESDSLVQLINKNKESLKLEYEYLCKIGPRDLLTIEYEFLSLNT